MRSRRHDRRLKSSLLRRAREGFAIENPILAAPAGSAAQLYRTPGGAEIDLLPELRPGKLRAEEVKRPPGKPPPGRGFHSTCDAVKANRRKAAG